MGASASVELTKPVDASDIKQSGNFEFAREEVIRLRKELGHLAKDFGINIVIEDASDIVLGISVEDDFDRCIKEISHIRRCLQLSTQTSKRQKRKYSTNTTVVNTVDDLPGEGSDSDSDSTTGSATRGNSDDEQANIYDEKIGNENKK